MEKKCNRLTEETLAVSPIQGVCPSGWHLPSYADWMTLFIAVGGYIDAGTILRSKSGWYNNSGSDDFGFSALPVGYSEYENHRNDFAGGLAAFWSASQSENRNDNAFYMLLVCCTDNGQAFLSDDGIHDYKAYNKNLGFSVRCLKD